MKELNKLIGRKYKKEREIKKGSNNSYHLNLQTKTSSVIQLFFLGHQLSQWEEVLRSTGFSSTIQN
jgi:hypothetical protein